MAWRYRFYRFTDAAAYGAAQTAIGWPQPGAEVLVTGTGLDEAGAALPGYLVALAWPGDPPTQALWAAAEATVPWPGQAAFAGWDTPALVGPLVSKTDLMDLFTTAEQLALVSSTDPGVAWWRFRALAQETEIDLRSPRTVAGVEVLVGAGIVSSARALRVLAGLPPV